LESESAEARTLFRRSEAEMNRPRVDPQGERQRIKTDGSVRPIGAQDLRFVRHVARKAGTHLTHPSGFAIFVLRTSSAIGS
jgi:hypothetical protein